MNSHAFSVFKRLLSAALLIITLPGHATTYTYADPQCSKFTIFGPGHLSCIPGNGVAMTCELTNMQLNVVCTDVPVASGKPVCSLAANPNSVSQTSSVVLTATCSPAATSYLFNGVTTISGAVLSVLVNATKTYTVVGSNNFGDGNVASATVGFGVTPPARPVCALSASPASITDGASTTLTATCTGATSYAWVNAPTLGSASSGVVLPHTTTTYTVVATNAGGSTNASTTVTVAPPAPIPTCTLTASPSTVAAGGSVTLTSSCLGATSYIWTNAPGVSGSTATVFPKVTTTYSVAGKNATGTGAPASATVTIATLMVVPTCTVIATPAKVAAGGASTLTATCTGATSYAWSDGSASLPATTSSITVTPSRTKTFTVTGTNAKGSGTAKVTVAVPTSIVPIFRLLL